MHRKNETNTHFDGTAVAVKNNIKHKVIDDFDSDLIAVEIETNTGNIIIATLYQPPQRAYLPIPDFITLFRRQTPVYMLTDLSANHPTLGYRTTNTKGRQIHHLIHNRTLQHIGPHFPTYIAHNTATTPDIILTNFRTYHNTYITQGPLTSSDHFPIHLTISTKPIQIPSPLRPQFKNANWENFQNNLKDKHSNTQPPNHLTLEEIDQRLDDWYSDIKEAIHTNIPHAHAKTIPHIHYSHQANILTLIFHNIKLHANTHGWTEQLYRQYRQLRQRLHQILIEDSNRHWAKILDDTVTHYWEPATFWRKLKNLMGTPEHKSDYLCTPTNYKVYENHEKEQMHREYWKRIFEENEEEGDDETNTSVSHYLEQHIHRTYPHELSDITRLSDDDFLIKPISNEDIINTIKKMKNTCPGISGINKTILRQLPIESISTLKHIFNASLSAGYFPDIFKIATLKLIPKKSKDPHQVVNYRPISLLEVPGKILEKIINSRLKIFMEINELHNPYQFGFRSNRGTTHALAVMTETIAQNKADGGQCHVVLRDITKAFDKVYHPALKYKILHLGLPAVLERLLCDFLDDRKARIRLGNYLGEHFDLNCGVPQGSVLSPTLFITYTRDSPPPIRGINISYADDVSQITGYRGRSREMAQRETIRNINQINKFEEKWKITTNTTKFTVMRIGAKTHEDIITDTDTHRTQSQGRALGLKITNSGYTRHVQERRNLASHNLTKLKRFHQMPTKIKTHLVKALILPILDYPPVPIHALSNTQISTLQSPKQGTKMCN